MITLKNNQGTYYYMEGTLIHSEAEAAKLLLLRCIERHSGAVVTIDLTEFDSVSSISLSFLLYGLRVAKKHNALVHYVNIPPALFNMARVSGIETILTN